MSQYVGKIWCTLMHTFEAGYLFCMIYHWEEAVNALLCPFLEVFYAADMGDIQHAAVNECQRGQRGPI